MNIFVRETGYWYSKEWLYLDEYDYKLGKAITFEEFRREFNLPQHEIEWGGNNPLRKSECMRFWIGEKGERYLFVEVCIFKQSISIHKVITDDKNEMTSHQLIKDLLDLDILYRDVVNATSIAVDELLYEEPIMEH